MRIILNANLLMRINFCANCYWCFLFVFFPKKAIIMSQIEIIEINVTFYDVFFSYCYCSYSCVSREMFKLFVRECLYE